MKRYRSSRPARISGLSRRMEADVEQQVVEIDGVRGDQLPLVGRIGASDDLARGHGPAAACIGRRRSSCFSPN